MNIFSIQNILRNQLFSVILRIIRNFIHKLWLCLLVNIFMINEPSLRCPLKQWSLSLSKIKNVTRITPTNVSISRLNIKRKMQSSNDLKSESVPFVTSYLREPISPVNQCCYYMVPFIIRNINAHANRFFFLLYRSCSSWFKGHCP